MTDHHKDQCTTFPGRVQKSIINLPEFMLEVSISMIREALEFAETLAMDTGELIRSKIDRPFQINRKSDGSVVTEIDLLVEREIRARIKNRWPDHSVEGEEEGLQAASTEYSPSTPAAPTADGLRRPPRGR